MICRRFFSFRFRFSVFKAVLPGSSSFIEAIGSNTESHLFFPFPVFLIPVVGLFWNGHFQNAHIHKSLNVPFAIGRMIGQT